MTFKVGDIVHLIDREYSQSFFDGETGPFRVTYVTKMSQGTPYIGISRMDGTIWKNDRNYSGVALTMDPPRLRLDRFLTHVKKAIKKGQKHG